MRLTPEHPVISVGTANGVGSDLSQGFSLSASGVRVVGGLRDFGLVPPAQPRVPARLVKKEQP